MASLNGSTRVLIVDDDKGMVTTLKDILGACGHQALHAESGHEAIEHARTGTPHAVLMDIRMPGLNGVDTFRELKRLAPDAYVIFMTAYATSELVEEARREGAIEVLPKPIDMELLLDLLSDITSRIPLLILDEDADIQLDAAGATLSTRLQIERVPTIEQAVLRFEKEPWRVLLLDLESQHGLRFEKEPWRVLLLDLEVARRVASELRILHELNPNVLILAISDIPKPQLGKSRSMVAAHLPKFFEPQELIDVIRAVAEERS